MVTIKATIFYEKRYWVGTFERIDGEGYAVAKHIFGGDPSDSEIYEFVLNHYQELKFGKPQEFTLQIRRMNPKRLQREIRKEIERFKESANPSTFAQGYMREELEKNKQEKKHVSRQERDLKKKEKFNLKQKKKKKKHRGH